MRTQAQMGQHAGQGALALGSDVRAAALVLDGRAQDRGNFAPVFDCSAFGRSLFPFHACGVSLRPRIGRLSTGLASAPGRPFPRRDTSLAGHLGSSARALPHFLFQPSDHRPCKFADRSENHVVDPFITSRNVVNIATGGINDVPKFRERGSTHDH